MGQPNFPTGPTANVTTYSDGTTLWSWDGTIWRNTGVYGPTGPRGASANSSSGLPKITGVTYTNSSYVNNSATSVSASTGGYIQLTGTNFASGCSVVIQNTAATTTTYVNSTTVNVAVPAISAGTYFIYLSNSDGGVAIKPNGIVYT
jgi:hypothetical protein